MKDVFAKIFEIAKKIVCIEQIIRAIIGGGKDDK